MEEYIGRYAIKRLGFFAGLIGVIERNPKGITPYILRFKDGGGVGFTRLSDVILIDEKEVEK